MSLSWKFYSYGPGFWNWVYLHTSQMTSVGFSSGTTFCRINSIYHCGIWSEKNNSLSAINEYILKNLWPMEWLLCNIYFFLLWAGKYISIGKNRVCAELLEREALARNDIPLPFLEDYFLFLLPIWFVVLQPELCAVTKK